MSIIALVVGIIIVLIAVVASAATLRAVLTDGYRRVPSRADARASSSLVTPSAARQVEDSLEEASWRGW